jgi:hypothetical protein
MLRPCAARENGDLYLLQFYDCYYYYESFFSYLLLLYLFHSSLLFHSEDSRIFVFADFYPFRGTVFSTTDLISLMYLRDRKYFLSR